MPVTTFNIDEKMEKTLEDLKVHFNASSKAELLRKAIALLKVASEAEEEGASIIVRKGKTEQKILLR